MISLQIKRSMGQAIDWCIFISIGVCCLCYSIFWSTFAELHIQLSIFNFPIFVGEILLLFCSILLILKWALGQIELKQWHLWLAAYVVWILIKAFHGYFSYGPLAFRNAALFYYPLFAVITYNTIDSKKFNPRMVYFLIFVLLYIRLMQSINYGFWFHLNTYFYFPCLILSCVLAIKVKSKICRLLIFLALMFLNPYSSFFYESKSFLLGNVTAALFLLGCLSFTFIKISRRYKALVIVGFLICLIGGISQYMVKSHVNALSTPRNFIQQFNKVVMYLEEGKKSYKPLNIQVNLFDENERSFSSVIREEFNREDFIAEIEEDILSAPNKSAVLKIVNKIVNKRFDHSLYELRKNFKKLEKIVILKTKNLVQDIEEQKYGISVVDITLKHAYRIIKNSLEEQKREVVQEIESFLNRQAEYNNKDLASKVIGFINKMRPYEVKSIKEAIKFIESDRYEDLIGVTKKDIDRDQRTEFESISAKRYNIVYQRRYLVNQFHRLFNVEINWTDNLKVNLKISDMEKETDIFGNKEIADYFQDIFKENYGYRNMLFRMLVWRDMVKEMISENAWLGINFGKPQRSISIEIMRQAYYEWLNMGWITPHNSYFHIIYRAGIFGIVFIIIILSIFVSMVKESLHLRSLTGILLCSIFVYWLVIINFLVYLELPYQAIPFWCLLGMTIAYLKNAQSKSRN